jgi:hypothetical protein
MFIIHRKGRIETSFNTDNQCKDVGWRYYYYHVTIATEKRDHQNFVIDHEEINNLIQELVIFGSCEDIAHTIYEAIFNAIKGIQAFKCCISPVQDKGPAYMEYVWFDKKIPDAYKYLCIMNDNELHY